MQAAQGERHEKGLQGLAEAGLTWATVGSLLELLQGSAVRKGL